jgi:trans-aconitate methyltransferase
VPESLSQRWSPEAYARNARFVAELGMPALEQLAPRPGERILDLGCGDGALTRQLRDLGCEVVGVDASPEMVAAAQALELDARVMNGAQLSFADEFDAVFSNAALHWMQDYAGVLRGVFAALRPGGRFVAEFGGYGNVAAIEAALQAALAARGVQAASPWFFPHPDFYAAALAEHGFSVVAVEHFPRPTPLPGDIRAWLHTFGELYLCHVDPSEHEVVIDEVADALRASLRNADGSWFVDYVRLRFAAEKPAAE